MKENSSPAKFSHDKKDFLVVGIGASAGGIKALKKFFSLMPSDSGMAFVVILHLSQTHDSNLSGILQKETSMIVEQVSKTVKVEPNHVYVIPPAKHLEMVDGVIKLKESQRIEGIRVPIDRFFRSLADAYGKKAVSIILSGTGSDGTLGMKHIKGKDGFAIVQDPLDAEYDGMPRSAIETKIADIVLPVSEMPEKLLFVCDSSEKFRLTNDKENDVAKEIKNIKLLRDVLTLLRVRTGHDFANYKRPTLIRRIARHLQIHETDDLKVYLEILREKPDEILSLLKNLLINVTNFFRDKEAFNTLEKKVIPALFEGKTAEDTVRIWIAGCASGEEAYSMAILLQEYSATLPNPPKILVFASDVDDEAIAEAREGHFTETIVTDVSPERLRLFFIKDEDGYRIRKSIREMVLFAPHNILRDPPFSRLDLISCRNVLIYLNRETQEKVLQIFHFALRDNGYLFLGSSETADRQQNNYSAIDKKHRIYQSRPASTGWNSMPMPPVQGTWKAKIPELPMQTRQTLQSFGELHHRLIEYYAPPSILVNSEGDILHLSESAGKFLHFVGGEPTNNILKVINPALLSDIRAALFAARQENKIVEAKNIRVSFSGDEKLINLIVRPVEMPEAAALIMFEENTDELQNEQSVQSLINGDGALESVVRQMENELLRTKDQLRTTIEQYETTVEELKASNEELQAMNEELRSATEELETGKEELQSVNEELTTVNHELKDKVEEISRTNSDLQNLMQSTDIATIFLDCGLNVTRFTPRTCDLFNIIPGDIGRPLEHITHRLIHNFHDDAAKVLQNLQTLEREVYSVDNRYYIARFSPYRTIENKIDGVVLAFIDITERKRAEINLRESEDRLWSVLNGMGEGFGLLAPDFTILEHNREALRMDGRNREQIVGHSHWKAYPETEHSELGQLLKKAMTERVPVSLEHLYSWEENRALWLEMRAYPTEEGSLAVFWRDITERREAQDSLRESEEKYRTLFDSIDEGFCLIEILYDKEGAAVDLLYHETNRVFERQTGLIDAAGKTVCEMIPCLEPAWFEIYDKVARTGESARFENYSQGTDKWYNVFASRVGGDESRFVAIVFDDITEQKQREANLTFLAEISENLVRLTNIDETMNTLGAKIAAHLNLSACAFAELDETAEIGIISHGWHRSDVVSLLGTYRMSEFMTGEVIESFRAGEAVIVRDVFTDPRTDGEQYSALNVGSFLSIPLVRNSAWRFLLIVYRSEPYNWTKDEIDLMHEITARIWTRLERARAEEDSRKSEEKLRVFVSATSDIIYEMNADWSEIHFLRGKNFIKTTQTPRTDWIEEYIPDDEKNNVWAVIENAIETKSVFELEHRIIRIDGSIGWAFSRAIPLFDEAGEIIKWFGAASDISEQKQAEKALRDADIRFRAMADTAPVLIWETDESGISFVNRHLLEFFGVRFKEIRGAGWENFLHPEDSAEYLKFYQKAFIKRMAYKYECRFRRSDGEYRWLLNIGQPFGENQFVGCSVDITENKRAEEALRHDQEMFYTLVEKAPFGVYLVDSDFCLRQVNIGAQAVFGNISPLIGRDFAEILHIVWEEPFASEAIARFRHTLQTGESFISPPIIEKRANIEEIEAYDWQIHRITFPDGNFGVVCYFYDLSKQKRLEAAVRESEERFSKAFNSSPLVLTISSLTTGKLIEVNDTFYNVTGYTRKDVIGKTTLDLGLWKNPTERDTELEEVRQMGHLRNHEYIFQTKSGKEIIGLLAAEKIEIGGEQFALTVIQDITIQKRAEQALRESEERLRDLIESITEYSIFTTTLDGTIDSWNTGAQRIFGFTETEAIGHSAKIIFTPEDNQKNAAEKEMQTALKQGRAADERFHMRSDGTRFYVSGVLMPLIRNGKAAGFVKIARDLTQQIVAEKNQHDKEMLQKLVKAQEDERRRIARDLHDELGQQLTGLRLKLEHLRKVTKQANISQTIDEIQSIAKGIDEGVDFIAWELRPTTLDDLGLSAALKKYVKEWSDFSKIKAELSIVGRKKIRLLPEVETNLYRITQEALNNVHKHAAAKKVEVVFTERNNKRILIISDDGKGFDPESKIKENKGLGLVGMQERAVLIGGNLEIESEEGKGTTIYVHVPSN